MKAHPIPRDTQGGCLCVDGKAAMYAVDFGGGKLFEICGECFAAIFGKPVPDALGHLSRWATTADAKKLFRDWMEELGAREAAKRLGGSFR